MPTASHGTFEPSGHQQCIPTHYTQTHTRHDVYMMTLYHSLTSLHCWWHNYSTTRWTSPVVCACQ